MCLTPEAYHERKWGKLPKLRRVLEGKNLKEEGFSFSAADNIHEQLERTIEIAKLAIQNKDELSNASKTLGIREIHNEIADLTKIFDHYAYYLNDMKKELNQLRKGLWGNI